MKLFSIIFHLFRASAPEIMTSKSRLWYTPFVKAPRDLNKKKRYSCSCAYCCKRCADLCACSLPIAYCSVTNGCLFLEAIIWETSQAAFNSIFRSFGWLWSYGICMKNSIREQKNFSNFLFLHTIRFDLHCFHMKSINHSVSKYIERMMYEMLKSYCWIFVVEERNKRQNIEEKTQ